MSDPWLGWAKQLAAIAQNGLHYSQNDFDMERYAAVRQIAAEMVALLSTGSVEQVRELFTLESGHATPKVDVRGVVFRDDSILLVKERDDELWTLPGGWADVGESPAKAAVREVYEESGFRTRAIKLLALYDRDRHGHPPHPFYIYKVFFLCEIEGGEAQASNETSEVAFFAEHAVPELSIRRVTAKYITRFFEHHRHPDWPADFD